MTHSFPTPRASALGRTTALRASLGLTGSRKGSIRIQGTESIDLPTYRIAHLGIGYCPEERGIFAGLSCEENLLLPPVVGDTLGGGMSLSEIYDMFPNLERSEEHTSELQSLMRISYDVFCLKTKTQ